MKKFIGESNQSTKIFPVGTRAWLVNKSSKTVLVRHRININGAKFDEHGKLTDAIFTFKGKVCYINKYGEVFIGGFIEMENFEIRMSEKFLREQYVDGLCKMACDPTSETYKCM